MPKQQQLVYLSDEQFQTLVAQGSITVDGQTVEYSEDDIYVTPQKDAYIKPSTGIPASDLADNAVPVRDVQVNGSSVLQNGVANIPVAGAYNYGLIKVHSNGVRGLSMTSDGYLANTNASTAQIKTGTDAYRPITPNHINDATFYGLAKAAGDTTQSQSSNEVGSYTPEAKTAIRSMIGAADADELNNKANRDGYYSEMTVGNAEQLVSSKFVEDQEPYTLRASGGSADIGNRENLTAIVGGTLAWNQQVRDEASENVTEYADIVTVDDAVEDAAAVKVKLEPAQDLHGYDHPWPAGGGKNLFDQEVYSNISAYSVGFSGYNYTELLTLKPNTQYTFSPDSNTDLDAGLYFAIRVTDGDTFSSDDTYIYPVYNGSVTTNTQHTITTGSTGKIAFGLPIGNQIAERLSNIMSKNWQLEEGSTATAWTPYENICPISGFDKVELWDDSKYGGLIEWNQQTDNVSPTAYLAGGSVQYDSITHTATAELSASNDRVIYENKPRSSFANHVYMFCYWITVPYDCEIRTEMSRGWIGKNTNLLANQKTRVCAILKPTNTGVDYQPRMPQIAISSAGLTYPLTIIVSDMQCLDLTRMFGETKADSIYAMEQAESGSGVAYFRSLFPADYYQYNAGEVTTVSAVNGDPYWHYAVTLPSEAGTVYGSSLTVNKDGTGQVMVDRASFVLDGDTSKFQLPASWYDDDAERGSIGFYWYFSYTGFNGLPKPKTYSSYADVVGNLSSDKLLLRQYGVYNVDNWYTFGIPTSANYIAIRLPKEALSDVSTNLASKESCMEWLRNNPVQFCYKIEEPQTYTLTASQVTTLLGTNNVWSDAGQVSLTYTGTDEHLTLTDGRKYMTRINGTDSMVLGAGQALTAVKGRDNVFDLTKMFGTAAVADYVYGQGAGYFRKWFPNSVYAYNPGELKSVEGLQSHDTVGFNLLEDDVISGENVGYAARMSNEKWQRLKVQLTRLKQLGQPLFYKVDSNTTSTSGIPIGSIKFLNTSENAMLPYTLSPNTLNSLADLDLEKADAAYIYGSNIVDSVILSNVCISLVNNGSRNGEYEPYEKHSYPLDSSLTLHGIPKAGANGIYWDGDQYKPDGTVERRYKLLTLTGNEQYNIFAGGGYIKSDACDAYINIADCSYPFASATPGYISDHNLKPMSNNAIWAAIGHPNTFCMNNTQLHLNISNDLIGVTDYTKETAQTALQKIKNHIKAEYDAGTPYVFILPLATPTTETAESYRELQQVDDWGTEEFVSTGLVPVGHTTQYPANLRDKLQHLPDLASSNGIYIVKQMDSEMELMRLPDMPTANGNYRLKLNVASGSPTFSWEAVT